MSNIFLAPKSSDSSQENFDSTMTAARPYSELESYLNDQEKSILSKYNEIPIWGNREGKKNSWIQMKPGDYVLFYTHGIFNYCGQVISIKYDLELGVKLWSYDEEGEPWPCLFFVKNLQEIDIPFRVIQELGEYKSTWNRVQGFMRLNDTAHEAIIKKFGTIEAFLYQSPELQRIKEDILEEERDEIVEGKVEQGVNKERLLEQALAFKDSGASHIMNSTPRKVRIENRNQKRVIARIENHKCQLCDWSLEYTNSKGEKTFTIHVDHIIDKAKGGGEEASNLWVLCPNCHAKKTFGVIKIDPEKRKITDSSNEIKLLHDGHLGWDR